MLDISYASGKIDEILLKAYTMVSGGIAMLNLDMWHSSMATW
jgi:hypothetical protein